MELTNSLIFQLIKMSRSIQNSNLSYNLNASLPTRLGLIQDESAGRWGIMAASLLLLLLIPDSEFPLERDRTKGRSEKGLSWLLRLQSGIRLILSPVQHFCGFLLTIMGAATGSSFKEVKVISSWPLPPTV